MAYNFRKIKCLWCDHVFMWQEESGEGLIIHEYRLKDTKQLVSKCTCPKCNEELLVIPNKYEAIDIDDERIEKIGIKCI